MQGAAGLGTARSRRHAGRAPARVTHCSCSLVPPTCRYYDLFSGQRKLPPPVEGRTLYQELLSQRSQGQGPQGLQGQGSHGMLNMGEQSSELREGPGQAALGRREEQTCMGCLRMGRRLDLGFGIYRAEALAPGLPG
jgi:hypothetical protein